MTKGFYNLPTEEQDRYNNEEIDYKAFYQNTIKQKIKRDNKLIHALDKESITSYLERYIIMLKALDEQSTQEHMYGPRGPWYVHKRAQNCFICDYSTMINQLTDILIDITKIPKIAKLAFASTKEGSQRLHI